MTYFDRHGMMTPLLKRIVARFKERRERSVSKRDGGNHG
jgi:hypothetical protein